MDKINVITTLARVLTSGVIMSIEKNEQELEGLQRLIKKHTLFNHVSLVNSYSAAVHSDLWGLSIGYGDSVSLSNLTSNEENLLKWLGINNQIQQKDSFLRVKSPNLLEKLMGLKKLRNTETIVVDFTEMGFGPCAAVLTTNELVWKRCERLKIFGAFDLRTMWTQEENELEIQAGVQFNYRLSPLVSACVKMNILRCINND